MVSDSPSVEKGGGGIHGPAPSFAYTEKFYEVFPYYLSIGMTFEQFWEMDSTLVKYYRKAAQIRRDIKNQDAWLQGAYVYEALLDASPVLHAFAKKGTKPKPYRETPFDLFTQQDSKKREKIQDKSDQQAKRFMEAFAIATNKKFDQKGGGVNG